MNCTEVLISCATPGRDAAHGFQFLALGHLAHQAPRLGDVDHQAAQEAHVVADLAAHRQRNSTTRSSAVTTEHRVSKLPGMDSSSLTARDRLAFARQQHVEESRFLPACLGNAQHLLRLRADVREASMREIEFERNRARGFRDETGIARGCV